MREAREIAMWFIKNNFDTPRNTFDGNMKLQKLLYFAQLINLAKYDEPLFSNDMYAFKNGTVVEDVRLEYKNHFSDFVKESSATELRLDPNALHTLDLTQKIFGELDARELSDLNHEQYSWKNAYTRSKRGDDYVKSLGKVSIESVRIQDLPKINQVIEAHQMISEEPQSFEVINGKRFYYNPFEITIDDELAANLLLYTNGESDSYTVYNDETAGLVVY